MTRRHILGEAVFDIAFPSEEEAFARHLELGSHVRERLLAVVDEVFDEVAGDGLVYRFDAIEIDLGELPLDDYQEEMAWRLRERLRAHLMARLPARQAEPTPGVRAVSQRRWALEELEHFLSSGRLPWNSSHEEVDTLEQQAWEVLRASGAEFLEFLKSRSRVGEGVTRRLITQFSDALLLEIAGRLAPTQSSLIAALAAEIGRAGAAHKLTHARARELRQSAWLALLNGLLQAAGQTLDAKGLVAAMLERMARRVGGHYPGMEKTRGGETKTALESFAAGIAALLAPGAALPGVAWSDVGTLEAALLTGSDSEIVSAWREALRRHPNLMRAALRRHGASARVRARLAGSLPESLLRETVEHLAPEGSGFVNAVIGQAGLFRALLDVAGAEPIEARQRLWAYTLGYLAVERGAAFSGKTYLDSLIRQSAAPAGLSRQAAARLLRKALARGEAAGPPPEELVSLLRELAEAPRAAKREQMAGGREYSQALSQEVIRGYDLLDQLRDGLYGKPEADAELSAAVAELAEFHPWAWSQLHRELRAGVFLGASLGAGLAPETLRRLIAGHLAYRGMSGRGRLAAIERHAARAADRAHYYRQVLRGLVSSWPDELEPGQRSLAEVETEVEAAAIWLSVEEPTGPDKDGAVKKAAGRIAPATSQTMDGWNKETLERLAERLPGAPHRRIRLLLRSAGSRAGQEPNRSAHGDLALSIRRGAGSAQTGNRPLQAGSIGAGLEADEAELFVAGLERRAAAWQAHAAGNPGMTPIPPRNTGGDDLAETPLAAADDLQPTRVEWLPRRDEFIRPAVTATGRINSPLRAYESGLLLVEIPESDRQLLAALEGGPLTSAEQIAALSRGMEELLAVAPDRLEALLAESRRHGAALERLVAALPERLLTRLLFRLRGAEHHEIQACADALAGACGFCEGAAPTNLRDAKWRFILGEWLGQGLLFERHAFARQFVHTLAARAGWPDERRFRYLLSQQLGRELSLTPLSPLASQAEGAPDIFPEQQAHEQMDQGDLTTLPDSGRMPGRSLGPDQEDAVGAQEGEPAEVAEARARPDSPPPTDRRDAGPQPGQRPSAREALHHRRETLLALRAALEDRDAAPDRPVKAAREPVEESGEDIYIGNAGLVLAAPYLPRLFAMLDLLDGSAFRDAVAAERAVRLSQYLVDGEDSVDEFKLVLNKILCGLATDTPIEREAGFSEREKEAAEGLLRGMIENWKGVGHTSPAGLRETFLRREGRLRLKDDAWHLLVAPKPFDMLLDSLPWSISVIRYRWMDRVIHVTWR